jgi:IPT/TIG domain-containing protein
MQMFRQRKYLFAAAALVLVFAGCKGESPTAPTSSTPTPTTTGGGVTPPTTANITITVSSANPLVNSTSIVTATVTDASGQPVANGTAVEFDTTLGVFTEANAQTVLRTTTNGVATVTLTSASVGTATVSAIVANVKKTATVTFGATPVTPQTPDTTPSITSITPNVGRPQGGEVLTITGKNFRTPLRVLFDFANGTLPKEATIISSTPTTIQVLTPSVDLGAGQQKVATIKLINEAGTATEVSVTGPTFTFQSTVLTPKITTLAPASGPIDGGTRVVVFGEGFQSPIQVFFGAAEAQVLGPILFNQFTVVAPPARDTTPTASGNFEGAVDIKVININSATSVTFPTGFRYVAKMQITTISPVLGSALGGTQVTINGTGFNDPLTVSIAGVRAQVIAVTGSQLIVRTGGLSSPCTGASGPVVVTNTDNGDEAASSASQTFQYIAVNPVIQSVTSSASPVLPGSPITVAVTNPGVNQLGFGTVALTVQNQAVPVSPTQISTGTGTQNFNASIPLNLTFSSQTCSVGGVPGTMFLPLPVSVTFTNAATECTATMPAAITVQPPSGSTCIPQPVATVIASPATCATSTVGTSTPVGDITIQNQTPAGGAALNITSVAVTGGTTAADFHVTPASANNVTQGNSATFNVTMTPSSTGARNANIVFTTNDPAHPTISVSVCGSGT